MGLPPEDPSTVEDFLENESFRTWITERRPEDQILWGTWLAQHPDKIDLYEQAVAIFLALQGKTVAISDRQVKDKTQHILTYLPDKQIIVKPLSGWQWGRWVAAAAVVSLIVWWQFASPRVDELAATQKQTQVQLPDEGWKFVRNATGQPMVVLLPDNSSVLLTTGSQLRYCTWTDQMIREVYLQGEGFFEVTKNPAKPFMVYTSNLTTKVLGTSFQVRSFANEATAFVKVKTGKVTVTPVANPDKPVLLTVNQELTVNPGSKPTIKRDSFLSEETTSTIITQQFAFNYTPIPDVFDELATSYHLPIRYDRELLSHCTFTGQLTDMPYLEKIRLICLTIESTFEIVDNQVVITSRGCK